jgi:ATP-binding cassette subfamily F protein 3
VYDEVSRANPDASIGRVRSVLGAFLYSGDDVDKPVRVLSGGERARVALARLLINPGNLLLMDEPTNHLDLASSVSLAESLRSYDGTIIFVSHNRGLIKSLATRIWNIEHQAVETYAGTLDEYLYTCAQRLGADVQPAAVAEKAVLSEVVTADTQGAANKRKRADERERKREEAARRKRRHELIGPLEKRIASLEERISKLEVEQKQRGEDLSDPAVYDDAKRRNELLNAYQKGSGKLEQLTARWENAVEELESAESKLAAEEAS